MTVSIEQGEIVGYDGHRAVIFDHDGDRSRILFHEDLPKRECPRCEGSKTATILGRLMGCPACNGVGYLLPRRVARDEWVDNEELTEPPEQPEVEGAAELGAFLANPRSIFEGGRE